MMICSSGRFCNPARKRAQPSFSKSRTPAGRARDPCAGPVEMSDTDSIVSAAQGGLLKFDGSAIMSLSICFHGVTTLSDLSSERLNRALASARPPLSRNCRGRSVDDMGVISTNLPSRVDAYLARGARETCAHTRRCCVAGELDFRRHCVRSKSGSSV